MEGLFRRCSMWLLFVGASAAVATAAAHHSFSATYDGSREMRIEGEVAQFLFRNPGCRTKSEMQQRNNPA